MVFLQNTTAATITCMTHLNTQTKRKQTQHRYALVIMSACNWTQQVDVFVLFWTAGRFLLVCDVDD